MFSFERAQISRAFVISAIIISIVTYFQLNVTKDESKMQKGGKHF